MLLVTLATKVIVTHEGKKLALLDSHNVPASPMS